MQNAFIVKVKWSASTQHKNILFFAHVVVAVPSLPGFISEKFFLHILERINPNREQRTL
jgi:thioredoxin-related protein